MKIRVKSEDGFELSTICRQLKLEAPDGKLRETYCANTETLFRIIQSIPSPKAEPLFGYRSGNKKINVDPSISPEEAVKAFYTYLKARRMEDGFKLLSREYLKKTNFEEWTNRFTDITENPDFAWFYE